MHKALHPRDDVDRFYVSRKERGRVTGIEVSVGASIRLEDYGENYEEGLITATRNNTDNTKTNKMTKLEKMGRKQRNGRFKQLILHEKTWT